MTDRFLDFVFTNGNFSRRNNITGIYIIHKINLGESKSIIAKKSGFIPLYDSKRKVCSPNIIPSITHKIERANINFFFFNTIIFSSTGLVINVIHFSVLLLI